MNEMNMNNINNINTNAYLLKEIEFLKYEFVNMSKKYEESLDKYDELERKNEFLLNKYRDLNYQFKLREFNCRISTCENLGNDNWTSLKSVINTLDANK
jgi:hypothetical protein